MPFSVSLPHAYNPQHTHAFVRKTSFIHRSSQTGELPRSLTAASAHDTDNKLLSPVGLSQTPRQAISATGQHPQRPSPLQRAHQGSALNSGSGQVLDRPIASQALSTQKGAKGLPQADFISLLGTRIECVWDRLETEAQRPEGLFLKGRERARQIGDIGTGYRL